MVDEIKAEGLVFICEDCDNYMGIHTVQKGNRIDSNFTSLMCECCGSKKIRIVYVEE